MSSKDRPFVSGIIFHTNTSWKTIMIVKNKNVMPPPSFSAKTGNTKVMIAAIVQCETLPSVYPFALTWLGKISEIKTQITAPCEKAKKAINNSKPMMTV